MVVRLMSREPEEHLFLHARKAWYDMPIHCNGCGSVQNHLVVPCIFMEDEFEELFALLKNLMHNERSFAEMRIFTSFREVPEWMEERILVDCRSLANEYGQIRISRCMACSTMQLYIPSQKALDLNAYDQYFWKQPLITICKVCGGELYQIGDKDTVAYCRNEPPNHNPRCIECGGRWLDASGGYSGPNLKPNYFVCRDCGKRMYNGERSPKYWKHK
jgi:hypothetical protein